MAVDAKTGQTPTIRAFDTTADGVIDSRDLSVAGVRFGYGIASSTSVVGNYGYTSGTDTTRPVKTVLPGGAATGKRMSWIELVN